jgi:hypothetical protein
LKGLMDTLPCDGIFPKQQNVQVSLPFTWKCALIFFFLKKKGWLTQL